MSKFANKIDEIISKLIQEFTMDANKVLELYRPEIESSRDRRSADILEGLVTFFDEVIDLQNRTYNNVESHEFRKNYDKASLIPGYEDYLETHTINITPFSNWVATTRISMTQKKKDSILAYHKILMPFVFKFENAQLVQLNGSFIIFRNKNFYMSEKRNVRPGGESCFDQPEPVAFEHTNKFNKTLKFNAFYNEGKITKAYIDVLKETFLS